MTASQKSSRVRILIADDHLVFRLGIRSLLMTEPRLEVAGEASTTERAVALYKELRPDVLLLDLRMPSAGGLQVVQEVCLFDSKAKILVLTSYEIEEEIYQVLQAGAIGYALKDIDRQQLVDAIFAAHKGQRWIAPTAASRITERALRPELTQREIEVLALMAKGLTNREIANVLRVAESTIKNHVNNLLGKLGAADRTEAVTYALSRGIISLDAI